MCINAHPKFSFIEMNERPRNLSNAVIQLCSWLSDYFSTHFDHYTRRKTLNLRIQSLKDSKIWILKNLGLEENAKSQPLFLRNRRIENFIYTSEYYHKTQS